MPFKYMIEASWYGWTPDLRIRQGKGESIMISEYLTVR